LFAALILGKDYPEFRTRRFDCEVIVGLCRERAFCWKTWFMGIFLVDHHTRHHARSSWAPFSKSKIDQSARVNLLCIETVLPPWGPEAAKVLCRFGKVPHNKVKIIV